MKPTLSSGQKYSVADQICYPMLCKKCSEKHKEFKMLNRNVHGLKKEAEVNVYGSIKIACRSKEVNQ